MKQGKCQLCLEIKALVKAHIFPQFMYEPSMFDEKSRLVMIDHREFLADESYKLAQSGYWDGNILCERCDNVVLSNYENYGRFLFYGGRTGEGFRYTPHQLITQNPDF